MDAFELSALRQREQELKAQIHTFMEKVIPLKNELEQVTKTLYIAYCQEARELPVWELRVNPAKTLREARTGEKITLCSKVTWQQMYDTAVQYFAKNGIVDWKLSENAGYKDCGQFQYADGYNGGAVLGVFEMDSPPHPHVIHAFDYEEITHGS
jgi:hypothetical protein